MSFTVECLPSVEQDLADLWTSAPDRAAVTAAANAIDAALQRDPLHEGEARSGPGRILFIPPLVVLYNVDENVLHVTVWDVWRYPP